MNFLFLSFLLSIARADPVDIYGFGGRNMGMGMGGLALNQGSEGWWLNPAASYGKTELFFGYAALRSDFAKPSTVAWDTDRNGSIDESDAALEPPWDYPRADGIMVGFLHQPHQRFYFGANVFLPVDRFLQIHGYDASLPVWFMYRTRPYRYVAHVGAGTMIIPGLHIGGGVQIGYRGHYQISATLTGQVNAGEGEGEELADLGATLDINQTYLEVTSELSPRIGLYWDVGKHFSTMDGLQVGMIYRMNSGEPIQVDIDVQVDLKAEELGSLDPIGLSVVAPFTLSIMDYYIPDRWGIGLAWDRWDWMSLYFDLYRTYWSKLGLNVATSSNGSIDIPLIFSESTSLENGNAYQMILQDTWEIKFGLQSKISRAKIDFFPRLGWAYFPSVIQDIGRNISPLDAPRSVYCLGFGFEHPVPRFARLLRWDFFGQYHHLTPGKLTVLYDSPTTAGAPQNSTSSVPMEGHLVSGGLQLSWGY